MPHRNFASIDEMIKFATSPLRDEIAYETLKAGINIGQPGSLLRIGLERAAERHVARQQGFGEELTKAQGQETMPADTLEGAARKGVERRSAAIGGRLPLGPLGVPVFKPSGRRLQGEPNPFAGQR